jgi:hypothetical protein
MALNYAHLHFSSRGCDGNRVWVRLMINTTHKEPIMCTRRSIAAYSLIAFVAVCGGAMTGNAQQMRVHTATQAQPTTHVPATQSTDYPNGTYAYFITTDFQKGPPR